MIIIVIHIIRCLVKGDLYKIWIIFFGRKEETNGYSRREGVWIEADTLEFAIYKFAYAKEI